MKKIIIHESKYGSTKKCTEYIKEKNNIERIVKTKDFRGSLESYDEIILCTPVYVGSIDKNIKVLVEKNEDILINKNSTIIISAMNFDEYESMIVNNFSKKIRDNVHIVQPGGGYNFESMSFLSKMIIKKMTGYKQTYENILYDNLDTVH